MGVEDPHKVQPSKLRRQSVDHVVNSSVPFRLLAADKPSPVIVDRNSQCMSRSVDPGAPTDKKKPESLENTLRQRIHISTEYEPS
jgi:hypothetical protein